MKSQRKLKSNRWGFEQLEYRQMLAGNVTVGPDPSDSNRLLIIGDNSANVITVTQTAANTFKVTGAGTNIIGAQPVSNITDGIFIDMMGGNDSVTVKNMTVNGDTDGISLGILLGAGTDALVMSSVTTEYACGIDGGAGVTAVAINKCTFGYDLGVHTYDSADAVAITNSTVYGALTVQLGNGTNALTMVSDKVLKLSDGGGGTPSEGFSDEFDVLICAFDPEIDCGAYISGGSGVDAIAMTSVTINCLTEIDTCSGADAVVISNSCFGDAPVSDPSDLCWKDFEESGLCIETGLGSDAVAIANTTVYGFLQTDTSGDICCPCFCWGATTEDTPDTPSTPVGDGNDAVSLANVKVLGSEAAQVLECCCCCSKHEIQSVTNDVTPDTSSGSWCCCCCEFYVLESGVLLVYTGNGSDAVALAKVTTDAEAAIYTTDYSSLDGNDAVSIANSSFNQCDLELCCGQLPYVQSGGLVIGTGCGNDAVAIAKVNVVGSADICTGAGTDAVAINALVADCIFADLGPGSHDALTVTNSSADYAAFYDDGGSGGVFVRAHNHFTNQTPPPGVTAGNGFQYVIGS
ncbi:MAG TPA: hypothetical protein VMJ32_06410 [Pirellulales bacterium]|nr:hypothetical protein [Pirellulales bacterium]